MPTVRLYRSAASVGLASGYLWSFHPIPVRIGSSPPPDGGKTDVPLFVGGPQRLYEVEIKDCHLGLDAHEIAGEYGLTVERLGPCSPRSSASSSPAPAAAVPPSSAGAAPRPSDATASADFFLPPGSPDAFDWEAMAEAMGRAPWELTDAKRRFGGKPGRVRRVVIPNPPPGMSVDVDAWDEVSKQSALRGWSVVWSDRGIELIEREQHPA